MEIQVNLAIKSYPYVREESISDVKGIVVCNADYANFDSFFSSVNKSGIFSNKCPHYYIDGNGKIYQILPENYQAKFAGKKMDNTYIQIAVQQPKSLTIKSPEQFGVINLKAARDEAIVQYKSLVKLCDTLCIKHSFDPEEDDVIMSQLEAYNKDMANKACSIEHVWKALDIRLFMGSLRRDVKNDLLDGNGYFHNGVDYSYVFNPEYYKNTYPDLGVICGYDNGNLFKHFIEYGMKECRKGNEEFDVVLYIQDNPDLNYGDQWDRYYTHYCEVRRRDEEYK